MATLIKSSGHKSLLFPAGDKFTLQELQECVGGYIELAPAKNGNILVVNEDGRSLGLPINNSATDEYIYASGVNYIVGDVLLISQTEIQ